MTKTEMAVKSQINKISESTQETWLRKSFLKLESIWQKLGPGLVTGASDDDPSGIATYTQAGAQAGLGTLWTAFVSFPLMASIQEMCGRIGLVTGHGIAGIVKRHYSKYLLYFVALLTIPACILNIGANLAAMGAVTNLLFPAVPVQIFTALAASSIILSMIFLSYKRLEFVLKWLTLVLLVYLVVPFLIHQDLGEIFRATFIPHFEFTSDFIGILVAILGTTISPYLFFWEASMEVEEHHIHNLEIQKQDDFLDTVEVKAMQKDNLVGMFFSNFVMYFVILTAASVLFKNGVHSVTTVEEAASALKPLAGDAAYLLFAIGIIGTGFLSIPVLAGSCSYVLSETFGWEGGMNKKLHEAKGFYLIIIISVLLGLVINFAKIDPVQSLLWTAIVYGIVSPILIAIIIHISNRKDIMGNFTNRTLGNILGVACFLVMTVAVVALAITSL